MSSIYKQYDAAQLEELFSNFLVSSWSYSKLASFSRNEKAFEMQSIYGQYSKSSASAIAGQAYHFALDRYFTARKNNQQALDVVTCEQLAFEYINERPAYLWKCQKTTPSVAECIEKCTKVTVSLLRNFFKELSTYEKDIKEVIDVEVYCDEFLTINGVDIPLPCHAKIDLVYHSIRDTVVIADHKSKASFSDKEELKLSIGVQAITYVNCYEEKTGNSVDEVLFVENKYSQNKDGTQQLAPFTVTVDKDTRRLYEAILYEPLKRMIAAVNDPDYVYLINNDDNFVDKSEIYDFWAKTMMAEVEEFNVDPTKKELVSKRLKKIRDASLGAINPKIIKQFRQEASEFIQYDLSNKDMTEQQKIEHVLRSFGIVVNVAFKFDGYSSNTYLLEVSAGVKITSIHSHKMDIANALSVSTVRIANELVVHEGRAYVSIEFSKIRDKNLNFDPAALIGNKLPIGKDNYGNTVVWDLDNHSTPHILICGATGSGKSVSIKSTIQYAKLAKVDQIVIFDPKYEFTSLRGKGVLVVNDIIEIEETMELLVDTMNELVKTGKKQKILVIFDEFADAVAQSRTGNDLKVYENVIVGEFQNGRPKTKREVVKELKPLEDNLRVLLQKGRSSGFRILAATQRASVKVITGDAKVNFPVQICFRVPKESDSRVVIDEPGAESLSGMGDGLLKSPEYKDTVRFQAYYTE